MKRQCDLLKCVSVVNEQRRKGKPENDIIFFRSLEVKQ